jgi:hypothetical protein
LLRDLKIVEMLIKILQASQDFEHSSLVS